MDFSVRKETAECGKYTPINLKPVVENKTLKLINGVPEERIEVWSEYLVGFFLDKLLSYSTVVAKLNSTWRLKGSVKVRSDGVLFLFEFTCAEDKNKILEADSIIMNGKLFIIKKYDPTISNVSGNIKKVPVWVKFYNIPTFAWSKYGINWISSMIGRLMCLDEMMESKRRIRYAKCLIEIQPDQELHDDFLVETVEGGVQRVYVEYQWKTAICCKCNSFGQLEDSCDKDERRDNNVNRGNVQRF